MAFLESPRFPVNIRYGSRGGPMFNTDEVIFANGSRYVNSKWSSPLYEYDAKYSVRTRAEIQAIYDLFMASAGRFGGFRVKDLFDYTSNSDGVTAPTDTDQNIGTADNSETQFQLRKGYTAGATTLYRTIKKPVTSTVVVAVGGVSQPTGWSVDTTTGVVTFSTAPVSGAVTAGFEFDVPCHFNTDDMALIEFILHSGTSADVASIPNIPLREIRNPD